MAQRGQALIQTLGLLFVTLMVGAFAIDAGLYFYVHKGQQNAADAAALAAADEFFRNSTATLSTRQSAAVSAAQSLALQNRSNEVASTDVDFGFVNPTTGVYNAATFSTPSADPVFAVTGGYNSVRVRVKAGDGQANPAIPAIFSKYLGFNSFTSEAEAVAIYGGGVSTFTGGVRPLYLCKAAYDKAKELYTDPTIPTIKFYGNNLDVIGPTGSVSTIDLSTTSCGSPPAGNWGMADFDGGGGGSPQLATDLLNGYSRSPVVTVGNSYGPKPGNVINANAVDDALTTLQNNGTVFPIPMFDTASGTGNNASYHISQFSAVKIIGHQSQGNNSYIKVQLQKLVCHADCSLGSSTTPGTATKLRLVH